MQIGAIQEHLRSLTDDKANIAVVSRALAYLDRVPTLYQTEAALFYYEDNKQQISQSEDEKYHSKVVAGYIEDNLFGSADRALALA